MDSVFFLLDLMDGIKKSLIKNHGQFTMTQVQDHVMQLIAGRDKYDKTNLMWSTIYLMNSLSILQKTKLQKYFTTGMEGPILWMYIISENQSASSRALRQVDKDLEAMKLSSFPGENVKLCTSNIDDKCH